MSRSEISTEFNTFVGGILTEANPINFPPGYSIDEQNFILERNGTRRRRFGTSLGIDPSSFDDKAASEFATSHTITYKDYFIWEDAVFNNTRQDVLVVIYDLKRAALDVDIDLFGLLFYSLEDGIDITNNYLASTSNIGSLMSVSQYVSSLAITLFGQTDDNATIYCSLLTWRDGGGSFKIETTPILIRDFKGTSSNYTTTRPTSLSDNHAYNLYNSGWSKDDVDSWYAADSTYPSLADSSIFSKVTGSAYSTAFMENTLFGTSRAPIGKNICTPWYPEVSWEDAVESIKGSAATDSPDFTLTSNLAHESIVSQSFHAGRLLYLCNAGKWLSNGSTFLLYSQSSGDSNAWSNCYQVNDPTSEAFNTPLDTDGGLIDVSAVGEGVYLETSRSRTMIFGTKGVFELFSNGDLFKPIELGVRQVSNNNIVYNKELTSATSSYYSKEYYRFTSNSVVTVEDNFYYWSEAGISTLTFNTDYNQYVEGNLSSSTIDTLYRSIPTICKAYAKGLYLPEDNSIVWAYSEDEDYPDRYNKLLCYDLILKAWYKFDMDTSENNYFSGIFKIPLDSDHQDRSDRFRSLTFLTNTLDEGRTTAYPTFNNFEDFQGSLYSSESQAFVQTGYLNANDSAKQKQGTYIVPSFIRTEDGFTDDGSGNLTATNESSCLISAWWNYADNESNAKVNPQFEAYKYNRLYIPEDDADTFNYGESVITTKNRLTGRGRALSLRFETSPGKDCRLLGWNLGFGANGEV